MFWPSIETKVIDVLVVGSGDCVSVSEFSLCGLNQSMPIISSLMIDYELSRAVSAISAIFLLDRASIQTQSSNEAQQHLASATPQLELKCTAFTFTAICSLHSASARTKSVLHFHRRCASRHQRSFLTSST